MPALRRFALPCLFMLLLGCSRGSGGDSTPASTSGLSPCPIDSVCVQGSLGAPVCATNRGAFVNTPENHACMALEEPWAGGGRPRTAKARQGP